MLSSCMLLILIPLLVFSGCALGMISTVSISLQGKPIKLSGFENDIVFRHMSSHQEWDVDVIDLAKLLCPHGNETIFDIGANLGFMTLQFSLLADRGHVYSWEPHPSNYKLLDMNVRQNSRHNVRTFNNAVSDELTTLCIPRFGADSHEAALRNVTRKRSTNNGDIKLSDARNTDSGCKGKKLPITTMRPDVLMHDLRSLDFIKIGNCRLRLKIPLVELLLFCSDVQGYEYRVLKSALPLIIKFRPYIIIEFEEWNMNRMAESYSTIDIVKYIREVMHYDVILMPNGYPADHLLVPNDKSKWFHEKFSASIKPLTKVNTVNRNIEAGVREQICLVADRCDGWKRN